ncbi:MAG: radical SAM family heme chaperone HemW [Chloroflexota bacterium]|nr:radical SAM family heme chaperone HemW [Chloroflexota bacterium]
MSNIRGLYIHVPFCIRKCAYCDFYSLAGQLGLVERYVEAVLSECRAYTGVPFRTLYLGGGTPSLLGDENLRKLIYGLRQCLDLSGLAEATIEVNPESATVQLLETTREMGIDRLSVGVQSLSDYELESVGRIHRAAQAIETLRRARKLGFRTVSADLIIGLPGQEWETLRMGLETLTGLGIEHLSLYCLSVEEGTPLAASPPGDLLSDDAQAELFDQASRFLERHAFIHYEISNFALKGHECLHNLNYWRGGEYLGLGPAAASHYHGKRFNNRPDFHAYLGNPAGQREGVEELGVQAKAAEEAMLRLRLLSEGLNTGELAARFGYENVQDLFGRLDEMATAGALVYDGSSYRLIPSRVLTSNPIFCRVLSS